MISALQHKSKFEFRTLKINQFLGFLCCSIREDLSIDVSITNVGLILTKLRWLQLLSATRNTNQNSISNFFGKNSNFLVSMLQYSWRPFHWWINYHCRTDIDEAKAISALQHKLKYKSKFNFKLFWKIILIFWFPCCSTREDLSTDVSITNVGLIMMKLSRSHFFVTS